MMIKLRAVILISLLCIAVFLSGCSDDSSSRGAPDNPSQNNPIPSFPWPPPKASAFEKISNKLHGY